MEETGRERRVKRGEVIDKTQERRENKETRREKRGESSEKRGERR